MPDRNSKLESNSYHHFPSLSTHLATFAKIIAKRVEKNSLPENKVVSINRYPWTMAVCTAVINLFRPPSGVTFV